jgi:hypothetical protein
VSADEQNVLHGSSSLCGLDELPGVLARQSRRRDLPGDRLGVVGHALDRRVDLAALVELEDRERGAWVAVFGLAHRSAVDEQHPALGVDPWLVGVPEQQHVTLRQPGKPFIQPRLVLEQVFVDLSRRAVN